MKKIKNIIFILAILLTIGLTACTRSASQPPAEVSEGEESAESTQAPIDVLGEMATQTALAESGGAKEIEGEAGEGVEIITEEDPVEEVVVDEGSSEEETPSEVVEESAPVEAQPEPAPVEEPVVVPEDFGVPESYEVRSGDHLYCIARRFDIDVNTFLSVNGLTTESGLYPGTVLVIPQDAEPFSGTRQLNAHPTDYTVQYNDTITSIACYFGDVDPRAIAAANDLEVDDTVSPGDVLYIP